jgi:hypothetical protein
MSAAQILLTKKFGWEIRAASDDIILSLFINGNTLPIEGLAEGTLKTHNAEYFSEWWYFQPFSANTHFVVGSNVLALQLSNQPGSSDAYLDMEARIAAEVLDLQSVGWWTNFGSPGLVVLLCCGCLLLLLSLIIVL